MATLDNRKVASRALALAFALTAGGSMLAAQAVKVEAGIPSYGKTSGVSGNLSSVGSDTLNNLMTFWAEGYKKEYPNIRIQIEGKGSTTAPPALIQGTSQLGPMSRTMKSEEIDAFEKKYGYKPTAVRVAVDGIGVFVNKDNPVKCLSMQQLDGIFSQGRACGGKAIAKWADAGVTGNWASQPISLYGRNSASGTYGYFKEHALCKGDYKATVKEQPGSASVVQGVTEDKYAIGYSGIGYKTSGVRAVPVAAKAGACIDDSPENVITGKYPLSRFLYVYVNKAPNKPFDPLVREFLKYVLSQQGQETVVKDGFIPLTHKIVQEELAKLQ